jgi:carboxylesterase type B
VGSAHASELPYVFGEFDAGIFRTGARGGRGTAKALDTANFRCDAAILDELRQAGNPNGGNLPQWPRFDVSTRAYPQFTDTGPAAKEVLRRPFCDAFIESVKRLMAN